MCLFALRYGGWHRPRLERWLWGYLIVSPFIDYASFVGIGGWVIQQWWLMTFVLTIVYVAIFWTHCLATKDTGNAGPRYRGVIQTRHLRQRTPVGLIR